MGYRSDVAYVVKFYSRDDDEPEKAFADFVHFTDWVKNHHTTEVQDGERKLIHTYNDENNNLAIHKQDLMLSFFANSVKWYESYVDVQWHELLLQKVTTYATGNYRFVRIGEEYGDVVVTQHDPTYFEMYDYVDVCRSLEFSPPHETEDKEAV